MRPRTAALGTAVFAATVPMTVAGLLPWWLADRPTAPADTPPAVRGLGAVLVAGGSVLVGAAFVRFVRARGTPAPIAETEQLVVDGPYRFSRNPQYVGVVSVAAGQALWWWSRPGAVYAGVLAGAFHGFVRLYEEPRLRRRFGADYDRFTARVPRWLGRPRVRPARSSRKGSAGP